jgi:hypothetical protein
MLLNRKFVLLIACICLFLSVTTLQDTYAKYTSSVNETTDISIARWRILVNDFDIRSSSTTSNLITPVFAGTTNIASGVIAPTATGYFLIRIDASGTDLSFNYTINIANAQNSLVSDVRVTNCTMNGSAVTVNNGVVTGTISLSDQRVNDLIVYIEWLDGTGETMNNAADTATTLAEESVAKISVTANFTQVSS